MELELLNILLQFVPAVAVIIVYHKYVLNPRDEREREERTKRDVAERAEREKREADFRAEREYFMSLLEKSAQEHREVIARLTTSHEARMNTLAESLEESTEALRVHNGKVAQSQNKILGLLTQRDRDEG